MDCIKIKNLSVKDTQKMERKATGWEIIFVKCSHNQNIQRPLEIQQENK